MTYDIYRKEEEQRRKLGAKPLKQISVRRDVENHRPPTSAWKARISLDKCTEHVLERLEPAEKRAYTDAASQVQHGSSVSCETAATLLHTIERLEHELAHAAWGGLQCDRTENNPPEGNPTP